MVSTITTSITNISFSNHRDLITCSITVHRTLEMHQLLKKLENGDGDDHNDDDGSRMKQ